MIRRWFISTMVALFCWGVWAVLGKVIGDALTGAQTQALSTAGMIPVMIGLAFSKRLRGGAAIVRGSAFAVAAGICGCSGNVIFYEILKNSAASTVVPLTALYPLITILLAVPILKERINVVQFVGVVLALVAIYLFNVQQTHGIFSRWFVIVLIPICLWGCAGLLQKISTNHITGELSTLWFLAASIPATLILIAREPLAANPSSRVWLLVALLGFTFALGNWATLDAFASGGKASIITAISGLYSMVSIPIAMIFLHEQIRWHESVAIAIALAAIVAISLESRASTHNETHAS